MKIWTWFNFIQDNRILSRVDRRLIPYTWWKIFES